MYLVQSRHSQPRSGQRRRLSSPSVPRTIALVCCLAACVPLRDLSSYSEESSTTAVSDARGSTPVDSPGDPAPPETTGEIASPSSDAGATSGPASVPALEAGDAGSNTSPACASPGEFLAAGGGCYLLGVQSASWSEASAACADWGGSLASLESSEEEAALSQNVLADTWIGLNDLASEGDMIWDGGEPLATYSHWATDQPDDFDGLEDCVELLADGRGWNDRACTDLRQYLCERGP